MTAHTLTRALADSVRPVLPTDLPFLTSHARAAMLSRDDAYRAGTEAEQTAAEKEVERATRLVRAKLAEMGVDPAMLRVVLS